MQPLQAAPLLAIAYSPAGQLRHVWRSGVNDLTPYAGRARSADSTGTAGWKIRSGASPHTVSPWTSG